MQDSKFKKNVKTLSTYATIISLVLASISLFIDLIPKDDSILNESVSISEIPEQTSIQKPTPLQSSPLENPHPSIELSESSSPKNNLNISNRQTDSTSLADNSIIQSNNVVENFPKCGTGTIHVNGICKIDPSVFQDDDNDGILNGLDNCPNVFETINDFEDEDGCPDMISPTTPESPKELEVASFVDETKDPQSYVDRYNADVNYREWFNDNYPEYSSIYQAVGLEEPEEELVIDFKPPEKLDPFLELQQNDWYESQFSIFTIIAMAAVIISLIVTIMVKRMLLDTYRGSFQIVSVSTKNTAIN